VLMFNTLNLADSIPEPFVLDLSSASIA